MLLVRAARVHTGFPGRSFDDGAVLVDGQTVRWVGPLRDLPREATAGAEVLDLPTATVTPGLIDAHVHLALTAEPNAPSAIEDVGQDALVARMCGNAAALLAAGVTTARDMGAPLEAALAARAALEASGGLRLLVSGVPITAPGAHLHFFGGAAPSPQAAADLVRTQAAAGVDWIKLVLSGGEITPGSHLSADALPEPAVRAAVAAARTAGLPVAVHAHTASAVQSAIELEIDTVEHCTLLGADPAQRLSPRVVCPTANVRWRTSALADRSARTDRLAGLRQQGSTVIAGTDAGIPGVPFGSYAEGLLALAEAGLEPDEVLRAATTAAAAALGCTDCGTLQPRSVADLVAWPDDPLADLAALRSPLAVVIRGRCVSEP